MHRIEVAQKIPDTRARVIQERLQQQFPDIKDIRLHDVYTIDTLLSSEQLLTILQSLVNPVTEEAYLETPQLPFDRAIEIGFHPGVTDNTATTVQEGLHNILGPNDHVYSSRILYIKGELNEEDLRQIGTLLANPLIQRVTSKNKKQFEEEQGMQIPTPRVRLHTAKTIDLVNIIEANDEELTVIGKQGIPNHDGSRRGPLALDLTYMKTIQHYFQQQGRNPTDLELESIAQTWSEHCHHTIFADPIDNLQKGIFRHFIKQATRDIQKQRREEGKADNLVSVFTDNSGAIIFDENHVVTHKVETHNSPSALDGYGGAITGIVGVNRDTIGFGLGALPVINTYYFCFGKPDEQRQLYRQPNKKEPMHLPRRTLADVIAGVKDGGNCSGIPTPQGGATFHTDYRGKPLVFVGTVGIAPRETAGRKIHQKRAQPGDYIVMVGGRVGKDGVHGATFSSEAMDAGSPATAVQIGDPITQKKLSDTIIKEARDQGLYTSITDNGAGGLSCSVAEMAKESKGFEVKLEDVPTKYEGMAPWEIWISESQERMTLAIPPEQWRTFQELMQRRGVETTRIGTFTNTGKGIVNYHGKEIMNLELAFLHDGLPPRRMKTKEPERTITEKIPSLSTNIQKDILTMLGRYNHASLEFIAQQFDHTVHGGAVLGPLQGKGRIFADTTVTRPVLTSPKGIALTQALYPTYTNIDPYAMATAAIDTAIRNLIAVGAKLEDIVLLDNFCWASSNDPERLWQLKEAAKACYDIATAYGTPFISGKDSMFNDFKGYDENGQPTKISIPPTLLISAMAVLPDASKAVSLDAKAANHSLYILGITRQELEGSEYFAYLEERDNTTYTQGKPQFPMPRRVPRMEEFGIYAYRDLYNGLHACIQEGLVTSAQALHHGGLALALAKTAMGGKIHVHVDLRYLPTFTYLSEKPRDDYLLFSETQGRLLVTVPLEHIRKFESVLTLHSSHRYWASFGMTHQLELGPERDARTGLGIVGLNGSIQKSMPLATMYEAYRGTFKGY